MAQFTRTWWGEKFIEAIETLTDSGRLSRGRSYARGKKVVTFSITGTLVSAHVRGSINPYFGVHKEPLYSTTLEFKPISPANWAAIVALMASKASLISRLLLNEIPDTIEHSFKILGLNLLPGSQKDFTAECSCPDYSNPCKHIAGVYYLIAAELDRDPFLLFELRGLSREKLKAELAKSPLGQALAGEILTQTRPLTPVATYYTQTPVLAAPVLSAKAFWQGEKHLPHTIEVAPPATVPAILVKKQGDFPPFWHRDNSFINAMTECYERVRTKNKDIL